MNPSCRSRLPAARSSWWRLAAVVLAAVASICAGGAAAAERGLPWRSSEAVDDPDGARVIVGYRDGGTLLARTAREAAAAAMPVRPQHAATLGSRLGVTLADGPALGRRMQVVRASGITSAELAARLAADPDVAFAEPSRRRRAHAVVPNDPYYGPGQTSVTPAVGQWYLRAPDAATPAAINAVGAWSITIGVPSVVVAMLDTGVRFEHPDLAGKLLAGYDFVSRTTTSNDGDGRDADASDPGDWTIASQCGSGEGAASSSWHGTQVAGLIGAATDNALGMAAAARDVRVLPVRVLGRCGGWDDDILAALLWAGGLSSDPVPNPTPASIVNLSFGATGACAASYASVFSQLAAAGVTVIASAGNNVGLAVESPASCANVIAVGGVRHVGTKVGYSALGPQVALTAPAGNCVNTTGTCLYPLLTTGNAGTTVPMASVYTSGSDASLGTSFSAPLVAGTAALMLSLNPSLTPAQVKAALQSTARPFPTTGGSAGTPLCHAPNAVEQVECYCTAATCGAGLLDASAAVASVVASALPTARIAASATSVVAGTVVTLDGSGSRAADGTPVSGWQWSILDGVSVASFASATNAAVAALTLQGAGTVVVGLTVTDAAGRQTAAATTIRVTAAPSDGGPSGGTGNTGGTGSTASTGSGGGGGATGVGGLAGVALAALALAAARRQRTRSADAWH